MLVQVRAGDELIAEELRKRKPYKNILCKVIFLIK